jgi:hypothetical protein
MPDIKPISTAQPEPEAAIADPAPSPPAVLEEPQAGGRYLRNPITGALTPNPD